MHITKHRAKDEVRTISDPPMAKAEALRLAELVKPIRLGLIFTDGAPRVYEELFFDDWMPSSFFLGLATKWASPHGGEELWRALSRWSNFHRPENTESQRGSECSQCTR